MSSLCGSNRGDTFGVSAYYSQITSSCFNDVVLVPLSAWIYLLLVPILFFLSQSRRTALDNSGLRSHGKDKKMRRSRICKDVLYALLIVCVFGMTILEVARLEVAELGCGLLPFVWPAFLLAAFLRFSRGFKGRFRMYWLANIVLWLLLVITNAVKLAEKIKRRAAPLMVTPDYPIDDQLIDLAVYLALYILAIPLEWWR